LTPGPTHRFISLELLWCSLSVPEAGSCAEEQNRWGAVPRECLIPPPLRPKNANMALPKQPRGMSSHLSFAGTQACPDLPGSQQPVSLSGPNREAGHDVARALHILPASNMDVKWCLSRKVAELYVQSCQCQSCC